MCLLNLDPPYVINKDFMYGRGGKLHKNFDHQALADTLYQRDNWVMSYNDCDLVRRLYADYRIEVLSWSYSMSNGKPRHRDRDMRF